MSRKWIMGGMAALVVVGAVAIWFASRPAAVPTKAPAGAPAAGSCWAIDIATSRAAMPWPGRPVACAAAHTAEVFRVAQVDRAVVQKADTSTGDDKKIAEAIMNAEARRACALFASVYLGANWHGTQMTVLANWITPAHDGFYGCSLAQTADPGATRLVGRTGSARGDAARLGIACVAKGGDGSLDYSPCDQPHAGEFTGTYSVTPVNAKYDATALRTVLDKGCGELAAKYLGTSRTDLNVAYVGPTSAQTWLGSDQTFACYAMAQVTLRGTVRSLGTRPLPR